MGIDESILFFSLLLCGSVLVDFSPTPPFFWSSTADSLFDMPSLLLELITRDLDRVELMSSIRASYGKGGK